MARFSQTFLQGLLQPTYQQGLFEAAKGLGQTPAIMGLQRQRKASQAEIQRLLQENIGNPAKLQQLANEYRAQGDEDAATAFTNAATQATAKRTAQVGALEQGASDIQKEAQRKRAMQVATRDNDERALVALRAGALDPVEYLSGRATKTPEDIYKVVGNRVFNTETGQYIEPSEAAELLPLSALKDAATPESLIEYIQTGDKSVLEAVVEDEGPDEGAIRSKLLSTDNILNTVKEASGLSGEVYPLFYDVTKFLPTTDARQLKGRVETLQSALAFDRLQQMRDESKTGGALGNVSNVELGLLGANLAALDPASGDFAQQLQKVEIHYTNFKNALLGQKPVGDRYVENEGILYYVDDKGDYVRLGKL